MGNGDRKHSLHRTFRRHVKKGTIIRIRTFAFIAIVAVVALVTPAAAVSPARQRTLDCPYGSVFDGEQVRNGIGSPPQVWRNVDPGASPVAFIFHAATVTAPDGTSDEDATYDHTQGVDHELELVTCGFTIPIGFLAGYRADFESYFVP